VIQIKCAQCSGVYNVGSSPACM